ncbi:cell adhesion molecule-related/down-regulated by oncogenes-like isoform X2 [Argopecten irradians]|uniref:cell adhesion molecule-related/down-regulated by oncogenes-like isoform X2 n=1 Tax=Argopecten irradians TaxID=31199 RepID=UPI0037149B44
MLTSVCIFAVVTILVLKTKHTSADNAIESSVISKKPTDEVRFVCRRRSDGEERLFWKSVKQSGTNVIQNLCKDDSTDLIDARKRCIDESYGFDLIITRVNNDDEGRYECIAGSKMEIIEAYDLKIEREAYIPETAYTKDVIIWEGGTVKLWCNASGYPVPDIGWQIVQMESNGRESVHDIVGAMADLDVYSGDQCGTDTDDLGEKLRVNNSGSYYIEKKEGDEVSLVCSGSGSPNATIDWFIYQGDILIKISTLGLGNQIVNTNEIGSFVPSICLSLFQDERRFKLKFRIFDDKFAKYICRASNEYGVDETTITIKKTP